MLRGTAENIIDNVFFSIMVDETIDSSNNEQLVLCHRWVDHNFEAHENFMGIHAVENIRSDALAAVLKDIRIKLNIPLLNACSQCYDGDKTRCRNTN